MVLLCAPAGQGKTNQRVTARALGFFNMYGMGLLARKSNQLLRDGHPLLRKRLVEAPGGQNLLFSRC